MDYSVASGQSVLLRHRPVAAQLPLHSFVQGRKTQRVPHVYEELRWSLKKKYVWLVTGMTRRVNSEDRQIWLTID